ncbi:MAG: GHKL domain-containing protein [Sphingobacteriales bacterium]|nr:MAG: GHKL domain-containing protein [Sphingobacteriales bacterium]
MSAINSIHFTAIGDMAVDGYFIYDVTKDSFVYLNDGMQNVMQLSSEELRLNPACLLNLIHPDDQKHAQFCYQECIEDVLPKKYEIRLLINDFDKYVRCHVFPINSELGFHLYGWVEDVTIDKTNKILIEQINARKNVGLEVLSHDLKEPMGLMKIAATSIQEDVEKIGNERVLNSLEFITLMCERNMKLVRSIINHEFLKSSIIELKRERVDIVAELHDVIRTYRKSHLRELKDFQFKSSNDQIFIVMDTMKFTQVINNLISNAIKFTSLGGVISISVKDSDDHVLFTVADNGIGIPEKLRPVLFSRSAESLRKGLAGEESSGLGMSIVKAIVDLHDGKIWFDSAENVGTSFYISLPK